MIMMMVMMMMMMIVAKPGNLFLPAKSGTLIQTKRDILHCCHFVLEFVTTTLSFVGKHK